MRVGQRHSPGSEYLATSPRMPFLESQILGESLRSRLTRSLGYGLIG